jgi:hypothetical protein
VFFDLGAGDQLAIRGGEHFIEEMIKRHNTSTDWKTGVLIDGAHMHAIDDDEESIQFHPSPYNLVASGSEGAIRLTLRNVTDVVGTVFADRIQDWNGDTATTPPLPFYDDEDEGDGSIELSDGSYKFRNMEENDAEVVASQFVASGEAPITINENSITREALLTISSPTGIDFNGQSGTMMHVGIIKVGIESPVFTSNGAPLDGILKGDGTNAITVVATPGTDYLAPSSIDTSAELRSIVTDETGTGALVFANTATIVNSTIDDPSINGGSLEGTEMGGVTPINFTAETGVITNSLTFNDGVRVTFNPNGTNAGLNVGSHAADPSSLANGDLWYNSTANVLKARVNGNAVNVGSLSPADIDTSAELAAIVSDKTGSGALVFGTSPTLATPTVTGSIRLGVGGPIIKTDGGPFNITFRNPADDGYFSTIAHTGQFVGDVYTYGSYYTFDGRRRANCSRAAARPRR